MKTIKSIISFLAIVNLLAMMIFAGWLWQSGRMNVERVRQVKGIFLPTVSEARATATELEAQRAKQAEEFLELQRRLNPPLPSDLQVDRARFADNNASQATRRVNDEASMLFAQLDARAIALDSREANLDAREKAWNESIASERKRKTDVQFAKTVKQYELADAKVAKRWIEKLVAAGEERRAVSYLDAISDRAVKKILNEFKTDTEVTLAKELLESLRIFGIESEASQDSSNVQSTANTDKPRP